MLETIVYKISKNLTSGSEELLFNFLKTLKTERRKIEKVEILTALQKIIEAKPQMAVFYRAMELYAKEKEENLKQLTDALILKIEREIPLIGEKLKSLLPNPLTLITHSNSSTVVRTLKYLKEKINIKKVFCTDSQPGGEGKKTEKELEKCGIDTERVPDTHILNVLPKTQVFLIGADAVFEKGFYNKVGTKMILLLSKNFNIKSFLLTSTLKISENLKHLRLDELYFEEIPLDLVDCLITEEETKWLSRS